MDWARAIGILEQANETVMQCAADDLPELETALAKRDTAVQAIAGLDPYTLPPLLAVRLRAAFEAGNAVRARLASLYRDFDSELHRTNCVRRFFEGGPR